MLLDFLDLNDTYVIKWVKETGYAVILAVVAVALQSLEGTDLTQFDTSEAWWGWAVTLGAACGRVAWATVSNALGSLFFRQ